jgi:hypothetical protein
MLAGSCLLRACLSLTLLATAVLGGCGSSSSSGGGSLNGTTQNCTDLCTAAQNGNCTTIRGDCGQLCAALAVVAPEGSCVAQYNAYHSCLGTPATVCSNSCGSQESALGSCLTTYCRAHTSESSCVTLQGSF